MSEIETLLVSAEEELCNELRNEIVRFSDADTLDREATRHVRCERRQQLLSIDGTGVKHVLSALVTLRNSNDCDECEICRAQAALLWLLVACVMDGHGDRVHKQNENAKQCAAEFGALEILFSVLRDCINIDDKEDEEVVEELQQETEISHETNSSSSASSSSSFSSSSSSSSNLSDSMCLLMEPACWALCWLTRWSLARAARASRGGALELCARVLNSSDSGVGGVGAKCAAAYAISNLVYASPVWTAKAVEIGMIEALARCLRRRDCRALQSDTCAALGNLASTAHGGDYASAHTLMLGATGMIDELTRLARRRPAAPADTNAVITPLTQQRAVMALSNLAQSEFTHARLERAGVSKVFVGIATDAAERRRRKASDEEQEEAAGNGQDDDGGEDVPTSFAVEKATTGLAFLLSRCADCSDVVVASGTVDLCVRRFREALGGDESYASRGEMAHALHLLAITDETKQGMLDAGLLPLLIEALDPSASSLIDHRTRINAAMCLDRLFFEPEAAEALLALGSGALDALERIAQERSQIGECCKRVLFQAAMASQRSQDTSNLAVSPNASLDRTSLVASNLLTPSALTPSRRQLARSDDADNGDDDNDANDDQSPWVMISYSWAYQPIMKKLRDLLVANGVRVWMDLDDMRACTIECMAAAIDGCCCVIVSLCDAYRTSLNCRHELYYAFQKRVGIVPVLVEPNYRASGWLGFVLGAALWYDISDGTGEALATHLPKILKEIDAYVPAPAVPSPSLRRNVVASSSSAAPAKVRFAANDKDEKEEEKEEKEEKEDDDDDGDDNYTFTSWSLAQVCRWVRQHFGDACAQRFEVEQVDGAALGGLHRLRAEQEQTLLHQYLVELGMTKLGQRLKFCFLIMHFE
jgi:TIR domain